MKRRTTVVAVVSVVAIGAGTAAALQRGAGRHAATAPSTRTTRLLPTTGSPAPGTPAPAPAPTSTTVAPTTAHELTTAPTTSAPPSTVPTSIAVAPGTTESPIALAPPPGLGGVRGRTIAIDPGHNGGNATHATEIARPIFIGTQTRACDTTGTQTDDGYAEYTYNLDVALRLRAVLAAAGAHVVMTRTTNDGWGPCIDERAAIGNRAHADVAISIHADGGPPDGRGFHVNMPALVPGHTDDIYAASQHLGADVRDAFLATGMPTSTYIGSAGLVVRSDLGGLNLSNVPKVLVETGNMRNAVDATLLEQADFKQREAVALAAGLAEYLSGR